jgi:exosortase/archaeosortase family protein
MKGTRELDFRILSGNRQIRFFLLITGVTVLAYVVLRLTIFDSDPLLPFIQSVYHTYLLIPEWIANMVFRIANAGVYIEDHQMVFDSTGYYHQRYSTFIEDLPRYMLYKRWSLLVLAVIWMNFYSFKRKIIFSLAFICVHVIAAVSTLYLLGVVGPRIIHEDTPFHLTPTLIGNLVMFTLLLVWVFLNKTVIRNTLTKVGIQIDISDRRIHEALILLFFFLVLGKVLIPFLAFKPYVLFLLEITRGISSLLGHEGYIAGDQLVGSDGALALAKHCLGLKTMYLFAALIFLTRPAYKQISTWFYLLAGLVLIFISNIARLVLVFVVAQGENGFERASMHHEIYNVGIYLIIFGMWVFWVEMLRRKEMS